MAGKHPYMSGSGGVTAAVNQLRSAFPVEVTSETLKKYGIASNNESYVINILRFVGVLDENGKKTPAAAKLFVMHDDKDFETGFADLVRAAYKGLFDLHQDAAWQLSQPKLIQFFRATDSTSALVGKRQAVMFQALAGLSGKAPPVGSKGAKVGSAKSPSKPSPATNANPKKAAVPTAAVVSPEPQAINGNAVGLTVRIEVNLPVTTDQRTYDLIFKSIRENLLSG